MLECPPKLLKFFKNMPKYFLAAYFYQCRKRLSKMTKLKNIGEK